MINFIRKRTETDYDNIEFRNKINAVIFSIEAMPHSKYIIVTGTGRGVGTSSVAYAMTREYKTKRILFIETGRKDGICTQRGVRPLNDYLTGKCGIDDVVYKRDDGVDVVASDSGNDIDGMQYYENILKLGEGYDIVIIDTPPVIESSVFSAMLTLTKDIVLVTAKNEKFRNFQDTIDTIKKMNGNLLVVVYNKFGKQRMKNNLPIFGD